MSMLLVEPHADERLRSEDDGAETLDELVSGAWEGLIAGASPTACPVCEGVLEPRWSAGAGVVGGRCRDCGTALS